MRFSWLHLTDLHLGMVEQGSLMPVLKDRFFEDLKVLYDKCGAWDLVIFSGDLTQSGKAEEFKKVDEFLGQLWAQFKALGFQPAFLAVPGNHDLARPVAKDPMVKLLGTWIHDADVRADFWEQPKSGYRTAVDDAFRNYMDWWAKAPNKLATTPGVLPGDFSATFEKEGARLGIVGLNSTFLQLTGGDYTGKLALDPRQFQAACDGDGPVWVKKHHACLLVTHQPPDWLSPASQNDLRAEIAGYDYFVAHLFGHMHEARYESKSVGGASVCRASQGMSLFGLEQFGEEKKLDRRHGYALGNIDLQGSTGSYTLWPRKASRPGGQWKFAADNESFDLTEEHLKPEAFNPLRSLESTERAAVDAHPAPPADPDESPFPKKWAILVGVNDYKYVAKLSYCRNDVVELARTFRETLDFPDECIFEFHENSGLKPERGQIFQKLADLRDSRKVGADDLLIFYFSGHGMNAGNKDYLLPIEATVKDVKNFGIPVENLVSSLKEIGSKNVAMFIDACRDLATGAKGTASVGADSAEVASEAGIVAFFSCDPRDRSYEIDDLKHGSFSHCILEAIKQGSETVSELDNYLKTEVPKVNTTWGKPAQQPYAVIKPDDRGSLRILYNPRRRHEAAQRYDSLFSKLVELHNEGTIEGRELNGAIEFLVQLREKTQPDRDERTRLHLITSLVDGSLNPKAFRFAWNRQQTPRGAGPQIQKNLPPLGKQP